MNLFWIHGGPGYNSRPEELLLGSQLKESFTNVMFWNHPSQLRGDEASNTWPEYRSHLEQAFKSFVEQHGETLVVGHSFGAYSSIPVIKKYNHRIKGIVWIAGTTDLLNVLKNIFSFVKEDYLEHGQDDLAKKVSLSLELENPQVSDFMNNLELAIMNENFANYYWTNKEAMAKFYPLMLDEWGFDLDCFIGVTNSLQELEVKPLTNTPTLLCYGEEDVVINNRYELVRAKNMFPNSSEVMFKDCSHFPHLEKNSEFDKKLNDFAKSCFYGQIKIAND